MRSAASRWTAGCAAAILAFAPVAASAHEAIDQRQTQESSCWSIFNSGPLQQSFTAGVTGDLTSFTARVLASRGGTYTVSLALYAADSAGAPTGGALANVDTTYNVGSTPGAQVKATIEFAFDTMVEVEAGTEYVVEVSEAGYRTSWCGGTGNPYADGTSNVGSSFDFAFATFVDVHGSDTEPDDLSGVGFDSATWVTVALLLVVAGVAFDRPTLRRSASR